jgi:hypothetical protein
MPPGDAARSPAGKLIPKRLRLSLAPERIAHDRTDQSVDAIDQFRVTGLRPGALAPRKRGPCDLQAALGLGGIVKHDLAARR